MTTFPAWEVSKLWSRGSSPLLVHRWLRGLIVCIAQQTPMPGPNLTVDVILILIAFRYDLHDVLGPVETLGTLEPAFRQGFTWPTSAIKTTHPQSIGRMDSLSLHINGTRMRCFINARQW